MKDILRILLVDDDEDDRDFFTEAVMEVDRSIKCHTAQDGTDAIQFLEQTEILPDFIFLDLNMPRMDGKQFLREIKKVSRYKNIPVIIYSTSKSDVDILETAALGADAFVTKPVVFIELCNEITRVITSEPRKKAVIA